MKLKLERVEIRELVLIASERPYKNGKRAEEGKTYSLFQYFPEEAKAPIIFAVEDNQPFVRLFGTGKIETVTLELTTEKVKSTTEEGKETETEVERLRFVSCTTAEAIDTEDEILWNREYKRALRGAKLEALKVATSGELTAETVKSLLEVAV